MLLINHKPVAMKQLLRPLNGHSWPRMCWKMCLCRQCWMHCDGQSVMMQAEHRQSVQLTTFCSQLLGLRTYLPQEAIVFQG